MSSEKTFIAAQLRAKVSLGHTILKSRQPDRANEEINQIENPHSEYNKEIVNKMIVMLTTKPKADILKIQKEINRKLESNIELNWGEKITHIAVKEIIKQKKITPPPK